MIEHLEVELRHCTQISANYSPLATWQHHTNSLNWTCIQDFDLMTQVCELEKIGLRGVG